MSGTTRTSLLPAERSEKAPVDRPEDMPPHIRDIIDTLDDPFGSIDFGTAEEEASTPPKGHGFLAPAPPVSTEQVFMAALAEGMAVWLSTSGFTADCVQPGTISLVSGWASGAADLEMALPGFEYLDRHADLTPWTRAVYDAQKARKADKSLAKRETEHSYLKGLLDRGIGIVFVADECDIPGWVLSEAEHRIDAKDLRSLVISVATAMRRHGHGIELEDGTRAETAISASGCRFEARKWEAWRASLRSAMNGASVGSTSIRQMLKFAASGTEGSVETAVGADPLELLEGAARERLVQIAGMLSRRGRTQPGILLTGASGTGKSTAVGHMANRSGRRLVRTSFSEWQGSGGGHLGDVVASMREVFKLARERSPSILFIDELDSVGRRSADNGKGNQYWNAIINALLELTTNASGHGDVVLVGATNFPELIDPALLRAGRFSERIEMPLPSRRGRSLALQALLKQEGFVDVDTERLAGLTGDCTLADLGGLAREARSVADEDGRPGTHRHVELALKRMVQCRTARRNITATAVGLAARAVRARRLFGNDVTIVGLSLEAGLDGPGRAEIVHVAGSFPRETAEDAARMLSLTLAPVTARMEAARRGDRGALVPADDAVLEEARRLASMIAASGAAGGAGSGDPDTAGRILKAAWRLSERASKDEASTVAAIAGALATKVRMPGAVAEWHMQSARTGGTC
jgi:hypothetical protein